MCEVLGFKVTSLKRIRIMNMTITGIAPGKWRFFTAPEMAMINEMLMNSSNTSDGEGMGE